jgi:hypothetical protein
MPRSCGIAIVLGALAGCGAAPPVRPAPASLHVVTEPETARVIVDERPAGTGRVLALRPLLLSPGAHRITVLASGYFPHDLELDLPSGATTVRIALRPVPP